MKITIMIMLIIITVNVIKIIMMMVMTRVMKYNDNGIDDDDIDRILCLIYKTFLSVVQRESMKKTTIMILNC